MGLLYLYIYVGRYISCGPILEIMKLFAVVILQIVRYALSSNVSVLSGNYFFKICVFNVIGYIYIYIYIYIYHRTFGPN